MYYFYILLKLLMYLVCEIDI